MTIQIARKTRKVSCAQLDMERWRLLSASSGVHSQAA